jgi:hypothetical protein
MIAAYNARYTSSVKCYVLCSQHACFVELFRGAVFSSLFSEVFLSCRQPFQAHRPIVMLPPLCYDRFLLSNFQFITHKYSTICIISWESLIAHNGGIYRQASRYTELIRRISRIRTNAGRLLPLLDCVWKVWGIVFGGYKLICSCANTS